jgi:hypothetical protein
LERFLGSYRTTVVVVCEGIRASDWLDIPLKSESGEVKALLQDKYVVHGEGIE